MPQHPSPAAATRDATAARSSQRVLFAISHSAGAGSQILWADLAQAFRERGHDASLLALYPLPSSLLALPRGLRLDHSLPRAPRGPGGVLRAIIRTAVLLRAARPDVIFSALPAANVVLPVANRISGAGAALFTSHHSPVATYDRRLERLDRWLGGTDAVHGVICVSEAVRSSLSRVGRGYAAKVRVVRNALPRAVEALIAELRSGPPRRIGPRHRVVACGHLTPQKNHAVLIRAMAALPEATLDIVGGGQDEGALRHLAMACGVADRVTFHGQRDRCDTLALMAEADVFAQPSLFEGHSIALLEAIALGLPLVVSNVPSQVEAVTRRDGTLCALVHDVEDSAALAAALRQVLDDDGTHAELRRLTGSLHAESRFGEMVDHYEALALSARGTTQVRATAVPAEVQP